ncbi:MAG TPA: hypothetical protein PK907_11935, partial [Candidatus Sabulitectum sp.]|nr:hypothetical protein [Candidatus Sabulitectum sp.]
VKKGGDDPAVGRAPPAAEMAGYDSAAKGFSGTLLQAELKLQPNGVLQPAGKTVVVVDYDGIKVRQDPAPYG